LGWENKIIGGGQNGKEESKEKSSKEESSKEEKEIKVLRR